MSAAPPVDADVLRRLAGEIDEALDRKEADLFHSLAAKRDRLLRETLSRETDATARERLVREAIGQDRAWIDRAHLQMDESRKEIEHVRTRRRTKARVNQAYAQTANAGRFYAQRG